MLTMRYDEYMYNVSIKIVMEYVILVSGMDQFAPFILMLRFVIRLTTVCLMILTNFLF